MTSLYETLGVPPDADEAAIRLRWKALAKELHPDNRDTGDEEKFKAASEAYDVLINSARRRLYDETGSLDATLLRLTSPHHDDEMPIFGAAGKAEDPQPERSDNPLAAPAGELVARLFEEALAAAGDGDVIHDNLVEIVRLALRRGMRKCAALAESRVKEGKRLRRLRGCVKGKILENVFDRKIQRARLDELAARREGAMAEHALEILKDASHEPDPKPEQREVYTFVGSGWPTGSTSA